MKGYLLDFSLADIGFGKCVTSHFGVRKFHINLKFQPNLEFEIIILMILSVLTLLEVMMVLK